MLNLNKIIVPKYDKVLYTIQSNTRAKLDTGTHCNYACSFCYYIEQLNTITPFEVIRNRINNLYDRGITEVDLSGGESSIHKDWFKILDYCQTKGFSSISTLSNGSKFSNFDFIKKSYQHGLTEILFSLHGWDEYSHDNMVHSKGAFKKILEAITNAKIIGIKIRLNCTVKNNFNPEIYAELINKILPDQINFLPLNYWNNASNIEVINYKIVSSNIKKCIDLIQNNIQCINVRYIPFCFMENYEKYVVGTYQHIFDLQDWNIEVYKEDDLVKDFIVSTEGAFAIAKENREKSYIKPKICLDCKYVYICDGIEFTCLSKNELSPTVVQKAEQIKDIQYYRKNNE